MWIQTRIHSFRLCRLSSVPCRSNQIPLAVAVSFQQVFETHIQCTVRLACFMQQLHTCLMNLVAINNLPSVTHQSYDKKTKQLL